MRTPIDYAPYDEVEKGNLDATYLVANLEKELTPETQEGLASLLGKNRRLQYSDTGHCAMISFPKSVTKVVEGAWQVSGKRLGA